MAFDFTSTGIGGQSQRQCRRWLLRPGTGFGRQSGPTALSAQAILSLAGRCDGNGIVDSTDLTAWDQRNQPGGIGMDADANGDGLVNASDRTLVSPRGWTAVAVPKPLDD